MKVPVVPNSTLFVFVCSERKCAVADKIFVREDNLDYIRMTLVKSNISSLLTQYK